jgi:hypothetical protein
MIPKRGTMTFHGDAAEFASVRYHKGVLYVNGTSVDDDFTVNSMGGDAGAANMVRA